MCGNIVIYRKLLKKDRNMLESIEILIKKLKNIEDIEIYGK